MMIIKIFKWLLLIIAFKLAVVVIVAQFYDDPRRDIASRKKHCAAFNPNTVFIGTSRTLYGIDPAHFDSLNAQTTRSYNFGMFSLSPYSTIRIADELLSENPAIQTIYIELSALGYSTVALPPQQVVPDAIFRASMLADNPDIDFQDKASSFLNGLNTTLFQMLSIAPQILSIKKVLKPEVDPIEGNASLLANGYQSVSDALTATNERIIANKAATEAMLRPRRQPVPNAYYLSQLTGLIARAGKAGKRVVFYYPNHITQGEYPIMAQVAPFLPQANLIPLPGQSLLEKLFEPRHLFDPHHLNRAGARLFTAHCFYSRPPAPPL